MIPTLAVLGPTKSGKTTLIEYLISNLSKEGFKIGTIQHIHEHGFSIDVKGKDTWRRKGRCKNSCRRRTKRTSCD